MATGGSKSEPRKGREGKAASPGLLDLMRERIAATRWAADLLDALAQGGGLSGEARSLARYLSVDLPIHISQGQGGLAQVLEERCKPADKIALALEELHSGQTVIGTAAVKVSKALVAQHSRLDKPGPTPALRKNAKGLASTLRRMAALESGIILPLAEARLTEEDFADLLAQFERGPAEDPPEGAA